MRGEAMSTEADGVKDRDRDKGLLEAALFLTTKPLSHRALAKILGEGVATAYVDRLLAELQEELAAPERGIELHLEDGKALFQVKRGYIPAVAHLAPHQDIPRPVLRSLAMIAYNHPMTQADLVKARGNKAYGHVQDLIDRGLIRAKEQGRTLLLHVTDEFLRHFGLANIEEFRFHVVPPPPDDPQAEADLSTAYDEEPPGDHAAP